MRIRPVISGLLGVGLVGVIGLILGPEPGFQALREASDLLSSGRSTGVPTDSSSAGSQLQTGLPADGAPAYDQDAERPTLLEVLERTGEEADFRVTVLTTDSLDERVSVEKGRGPVVEFVRRLLAGFSKVLVFARDTDGKPGRLVEVIVLSAISPAETMVASSGDSDDAPSAGWNRRAAEAMLDSLDPSHPETYMATVEALKDLAPEQAVDELVERLEGEDQELAAQALGFMESPSAVDALIHTFNTTSVGSVREAAANSLAQIGGSTASDFLLRTTAEQVSARKSAAAWALAFEGGKTAAQSLADGIETGAVSPEGILQEAQVVTGLYGSGQTNFVE